MALGLEGHGLSPSSLGDPQEDARPPDLKPRLNLAVSDLLKDRPIVGSNRDRTRFSATHGASSLSKKDPTSSIAATPEFRALLVARDTSGPIVPEDRPPGPWREFANSIQCYSPPFLPRW